MRERKRREGRREYKGERYIARKRGKKLGNCLIPSLSLSPSLLVYEQSFQDLSQSQQALHSALCLSFSTHAVFLIWNYSGTGLRERKWQQTQLIWWYFKACILFFFNLSAAVYLGTSSDFLAIPSVRDVTE